MLSISAARTAGGASSYYLHMEKDSLGHAGEYYTKEGEAGYWIGNGANHLGLEGQVAGKAFKALADGFGPDGQKLARNAGEEGRRAGWDATFSAPKSVSVAWGIGDADTRAAIEKAHAVAVQQGFNVIQERAGYVRTGAQGQHLERAELVGAAFQHGTSREQDAQLHTHVFIMNAGMRSNGSAASLEPQLLFDYKMAAGAAYQCALAHKLEELGYKLERDGPESFRISSVPRSLEEAQSTRSQQIQAELARTGQTGAKAAAVATLKTRAAKGEQTADQLRDSWRASAREHGFTPSMAQPGAEHLNQKDNHHERHSTQHYRPGQQREPGALPLAHRAGVTALGRIEGLGRQRSQNNLRTLQGRSLDPHRGGTAMLLSRDARHRVEQARAQQLGELRRAAVVEARTTSAAFQEKNMPTARQVLNAATERDAIVTQAQILTQAYRLSITQGSTLQAEAVASRAQRQAVAIERTDGQREQRSAHLARYTTKELMQAERDVLRIALDRKEEGRHALDRHVIETAIDRTEAARSKPGQEFKLNQEQRDAVLKLAGTPGGVQVLVGDAGTGKSTTMQAVREAHEAAGLRVIGTSTGTKASQELAASAGIESRNIAKLCSDLERGQAQLNSKTVLVIDEAGMTNSRDMARLMRAADETGAKVILVGDWKQLQPVGAGETFRAIDKELGSTRLESINRQSNEWERETVKQLSRGEAADALKTYAKEDRIHVDATYQKAIKDVAQRHLDNVREVGADKTVALAGTNRAVDDINQAVREGLKKDGQLQDGHIMTTRDEDRNSGERKIELAAGDRVVIGNNDRECRFTNGDAGTVQRIDPKTNEIEMKLDRTGETVKINVQDNEVRHGYAMTTHKAQGSTFDRATVYLDSNSSREMAYVQASRARAETHFVVTTHTVKEMRADAQASPELQKAIDQVAAARVAAGKETGLEPDTKKNMQAAIDFIKENKEHAPKEARQAADKAQTLEALGSAMSRSRPKETTLDYQAKPGQEGGRVSTEQSQGGRATPGRPMTDAQHEAKWRDSLSQVEKAVLAKGMSEVKQAQRDMGQLDKGRGRC